MFNDCLGCLADKTPRSYGENIFLRGMMTAAHELYDEERTALSAPNDVLLATLNKSRIQAEISAKINTFFDSNFGVIGGSAYFDCGQKLNAFAVLPSETVIFCDDYTFGAFHKCGNCLETLLFEFGQIVRRSALSPRKCGFCGKMFLGTEDEVCCRQATCQTAHKEQKEAIYKEHTEEYSQIKRTMNAGFCLRGNRGNRCRRGQASRNKTSFHSMRLSGGMTAT